MSSQNFIIKRLLPGQDLKGEIQALVRENHIQAGVVLSSVGSLTQLALRLANENESTVRKEDFEIINLNGTLSLDGVHLHLSAADSKGALLGGHLLEGCLIRTTCELVIQRVPGVEFFRRLDSLTGFSELIVEKK